MPRRNLEDVLLSKTKAKLIEVLYEALDLMNQYNGRSHMYCIAVALGYEAVENEDGSTTFKKPLSPESSNTYTHRRVKDATYRVRKMRNKDLFMVTEYYKGDRVQLCDDNLPHYRAHQLAYELADRDDF